MKSLTIGVAALLLSGSLSASVLGDMAAQPFEDSCAEKVLVEEIRGPDEGLTTALIIIKCVEPVEDAWTAYTTIETDSRGSMTMHSVIYLRGKEIYRDTTVLRGQYDFMRPVRTLDTFIGTGGG